MKQKQTQIFTFFLLALFFLTACENRSIVIYSIPERDANEIVVLLSSKGIDAMKTPAPASTVGGVAKETLWDISVAPQNVTAAITTLNQAGLPRVKETTLLDLFGTQGLVPSDLQDRIRYQEGLSDQLANTIRKMDGVIDADVQISFSHTEEAPKELTASVYVKHRGILDSPNSPLVIKIKRLVASSIPDLKIENVTVVTDRAIYADIGASNIAGQGREVTLEYVSIWGVLVAQKSASIFRLIFYIFLILLFLSLTVIGWLIWKFYPLLEKRGGPKALLEPTPFKDVQEEPVVE